jgi:hypothetical protein
VFIKAVFQAFQKYKRGEKGALHFERVQSGAIEHGRYRLAPRVFTRHSIFEIARRIDSQSFILRFTNDNDKRVALRGLDTLEQAPKFNHRQHVMGSRSPAISIFFDIGNTLRGLMKIGLNLLAASCEKTSINLNTFSQAIKLVRGEIALRPSFLGRHGFVRHGDLEAIKSPPGTHSFRVMYTDREWWVYLSFFGGRIGAHVSIPGPSKEDWNCADIVAPLNSKAWTVSKRRLYLPMKVHIEWQSSKTICPSLNLLNAVSDIKVEVFKQKDVKK